MISGKFGFFIGILYFPVYVNGFADIVNKNVERNIDISSQLVKVSIKISAYHLKNQEFNSYSFIIPVNEYVNLAYISIKDISSKKELKYQEIKISNGYEYKINFPTTSSTSFHMEAIFTNALQPYPAKITQNEKQFVRFFGNAYFYTPYYTYSQKTTYQLSSSIIEFNTNNPQPITHVGSRVSYGPYENIEPYATAKIVLHYENQTPFLTVTNLERIIEVSHWGNIAVEETVDMIHSGAELKGPFSRYDFQKDARSAQSSIKTFKTILPASASNVYYRDTNGNISTSNMKILKEFVELDLKPRYPLFGGWKSHYTVGYSVPSFEYLFYLDNNYFMKMRVIDHIFDDMVVAEATVKIILPEGASNIKLIPPYPVDRQSDSVHYTYLDTSGRPVVIFKKKNLVENHINDFNIKYTFVKVTMLQEPILVIMFFFAMFSFVIVYIRLDFSIHKEKEN